MRSVLLQTGAVLLNATVVGALSKHYSLVFGEEGGGRKVLFVGSIDQSRLGI